MGGERDPKQINLGHWAAEAELCGVAPRFLQGWVTDSAQRILVSLPEAKRQFVNHFGEYPAIRRVERVVKRQCTQTLRTRV